MPACGTEYSCRHGWPGTSQCRPLPHRVRMWFPHMAGVSTAFPVFLTLLSQRVQRATHYDHGPHRPLAEGVVNRGDDLQAHHRRVRHTHLRVAWEWRFSHGRGSAGRVDMCKRSRAQRNTQRCWWTQARKALRCIIYKAHHAARYIIMEDGRVSWIQGLAYLQPELEVGGSEAGVGLNPGGGTLQHAGRAGLSMRHLDAAPAEPAWDSRSALLLARMARNVWQGCGGFWTQECSQPLTRAGMALLAPHPACPTHVTRMQALHQR